MLGDTPTLPTVATLPISWSILTVLAPETSQLSVVAPPEAMIPGLVAKEFITGASAIASAIETETRLRTSSDQSPLLS